ncbi:MULTISPECIES: ureidoglycolate lyase [Paracoccaceae]|jgi:ureidoglycolate lyase|uniref:ureidoglycolate lyase n=1 Tax=Rhodobacterales TaxID=204455 RepID=UPI001B1C91A6|nr:ureidoglycolate lyase [Boseongicola sp. H5]MBO6602352.1 ureidoglycolate lyase [Roseicyclus sp.]MBO6623771.1 ureidoglycolate lyase [Roseicyclus sp.]MBO6922271.1 ureidoglycolate lyase [Roseicyclus sp.]
MTGPVLKLQPPDAAAFAPYGDLVLPPEEPGTRRFYSTALHARGETSAPVLHVNNVAPQALPLAVTRIERHPFAAQCFFPLDVSRYAVMVMPSDIEGRPLPDRALAFLMPGTIGVIFNPGVWHLGATVLDRPGHFTVLMWRGGPMQDDDFRTIAPLTLIDPTDPLAGA